MKQRCCCASKAWTALSGQKATAPKDEGLGMMMSAFVSRWDSDSDLGFGFGFGLKQTQEKLQKVNQARQGTKCSGKAAAKETRRGNANKQPLAKAPFIVKFEHGANNEGRWVCDHMIQQFEDCADVVKTLLWPEFDCALLFDHSGGHNRQCPDGLKMLQV